MREINLLEDIIKYAKFKAWDSYIGDKKADDIMDEIHAGKYGNKKSGMWIQAKNAIDRLKENR